MTLQQAPTAVLMIRPHRFTANPETAADNSFQTCSGSVTGEEAITALGEFDQTVNVLEAKGITVHVFDDHGDRNTPDSVFPNNWFSTHTGGHIAVYPMFTANRRLERRWDIVEFLKREYRVQDVIDYSGLEEDNLSLEGTGAMVLDHIERVAYTAQSNRADPVILERFCTNFNFEPMVFQSENRDGAAVYHTNVIMAIATNYALICSSMIVDPDRRKAVLARLEESGRDVIDLSEDQIDAFAGNAMELTAGSTRYLAMSSKGVDSLTGDQKTRIEARAALLPISIPTIETAGGSVRCMMAGIHLSKRR
ncbi:citrulline utilization hydrolase CtlX [uncultured Tateyamaria sp.]|uniref:citrulline utilization hydrolase CtlX n=1 Tax=uncultured Tateyamaria sp. TaxID=455651 RepID=UPI0026070162|nr:arginine deiminase-related protein [uncultured Tateyamaria sp.]